MTVMTLLASDLRWPECPRWHCGRMYVVDMPTGRVLAADSTGTLELVEQLPGMVGGIGWLPDGRRLTVSMLDRRLLVSDTPPASSEQAARARRSTVHADLAPISTGPINDLAVDSGGRSYVSQIGYNIWQGEAPVESHLLVVEPDGRARAAVEIGMFATANGLAITADGGTLVIAETNARQLVCCSIAADGTLSARRQLAELPGTPDGICLDPTGGVWVALLDRSCIRVAPDGSITHRVELERGCGGAIACAVGGATSDMLFICAGRWRGDMSTAEGPRSGTVWTTPLPRS